MKKMFLLLAAASLVSATAFAQDDYDYGDDYAPEASAPAADEGYTDVGSSEPAAAEPASDVEYKSMDNEETKVKRNEGTKPAFFEKPFNIAAHIGLGYGTFWNVPDAFDDAAWRETFEMDSNPYDEWLGLSVSFGAAFNYRFTDLISVSPEFNFGIRGFFRNLETYYSWWYDSYVDVDENLFMFDIEIPILARVMPTQQFYIEAGPQFSIKLAANHSITYTDEWGTELASDDAGSWECSSAFVAIVVGAGATVDIDGKLFDIGARFIMDMTKLEKDNTDYPNLDGSTFKDETKMWAIQLVVKYWI